MPAVRKHGAVFHHFNVLAGYRLQAAGERDEDVPDMRRLRHAHNLMPVHSRLKRARMIDLSDDDIRAHAARPQRHAAPAPAVARDHHLLARPKYVRGARDAVQRALPRAVAVVEEVLGIRVVHRDNRIPQPARARQAPQPDNARGRLFSPADDALYGVAALRVQRGYQIRAVVHRDVGAEVKRGVDVRVVGIVVFALDGECGDAVFARQRRRHIVLRAQRIAGAYRRLRAAVLQREHQVRGFGGHMQAGGYSQPGQRLFFGKALPNLAQHRHLALSPAYPPYAVGRQRAVFNVRARFGCQIVPP